LEEEEEEEEEGLFKADAVNEEDPERDRARGRRRRRRRRAVTDRDALIVCFFVKCKRHWIKQGPGGAPGEFPIYTLGLNSH